jgi:hypothetical protein
VKKFSLREYEGNLRRDLSGDGDVSRAPIARNEARDDSSRRLDSIDESSGNLKDERDLQDLHMSSEIKASVIACYKMVG